MDPALLTRIAAANERQADALEAEAEAAELSAAAAEAAAVSASSAADDAAASASSASASAAAAAASATASEAALTTAAAAEETAEDAVEQLGWAEYFPPSDNTVIVPHGFASPYGTNTYTVSGGDAGGDALSSAVYRLQPGAKVKRVAVKTGGPQGATTIRLALYECENGRARTRVWQSAAFTPAATGFQEVELAEPLVLRGGFYLLAIVHDVVDDFQLQGAVFYNSGASVSSGLVVQDPIYGDMDLDGITPILRPAYAWQETDPGRWEPAFLDPAPSGAPSVLPWPEDHPDFEPGDLIVAIGVWDTLVSYIGVER